MCGTLRTVHARLDVEDVHSQKWVEQWGFVVGVAVFHICCVLMSCQRAMPGNDQPLEVQVAVISGSI